MTKKFSTTEKFSFLFAILMLVVILGSVVYLISGDKNGLGSIFNSGKSSSNQNSATNSENYTAKVNCQQNEFVKNYVPDQFFVDKIKAGGVVENTIQSIYAYTFVNDSTIKSTDLAANEFDQFGKLGIFSKTENTLFNPKSYDDTNRLTLVNLLETPSAEMTNIAFKPFMKKYYCGQVKAGFYFKNKVSTAKNIGNVNVNFSSENAIDKFILNAQKQVDAIENLDGVELEKNVYAENKLTDTAMSFDYQKMYIQFKKITTNAPKNI